MKHNAEFSFKFGLLDQMFSFLDQVYTCMVLEYFV